MPNNIVSHGMRSFSVCKSFVKSSCHAERCLTLPSNCHIRMRIRRMQLANLSVFFHSVTLVLSVKQEGCGYRF